MILFSWPGGIIQNEMTDTISRNHESSVCILYDITEPREFSVHLVRYHGTTRVQCASYTISRNHESSAGRSSTPNVEGLPDLADLPDLVIPDDDSCTGNDTVLYTIY